MTVFLGQRVRLLGSLVFGYDAGRAPPASSVTSAVSNMHVRRSDQWTVGIYIDADKFLAVVLANWLGLVAVPTDSATSILSQSSRT